MHNNRCPGGHGDWAATDQGSGARFQADVDLDALHLDRRVGRLARAGRLTLLVDGVATAPTDGGAILIRPA